MAGIPESRENFNASQQMTTSSSDIGNELEVLGDPSGRQDSLYWDKWFNVVCCKPGQYQPFEWYCGAEEVIRVLSHHLSVLVNEERTTRTNRRRMIHPGSGTSLVPFKLQEVFKGHDHVIVDVSPVAMEEMEQIHAKQQQRGAEPNTEKGCCIHYQVCNLLEPPLPFSSSSFDAWVDKGFLDAIFCDKNPHQNQEQSKKLFKEASRVLADNLGVACIVSLAENHSLQLIVDRWVEGSSDGDNDSTPSPTNDGWSKTIHIWELEPVSGDMRPFGFVLQQSEGTAVTSTNRTIVWHSMNGEVNEYNAAHSSSSSSSNSVCAQIQTLVANSRATFVRNKVEPETSLSARRKVLLRLEIKAYDTTAPLDKLGESIRSITWTTDEGARDLLPQWQPFRDDDHKNSESLMFKIVPIGFGISKLLLQCIIPSDDVDELLEAIQEWDGDETFEDGIQSVDVDWTSTVPVGDVENLVTKSF